jgi:hydroxymethylglutaryl-CoA lyase
LKKQGNAIFSGLVLNEKGLERGIDCGVEMFCMGVSASETHSRKNTGMSIDEATRRIVAMAKLAEAAERRVQVSVQSAFGCGYEGYVPQERVMKIVEQYLEAGLRNISLADTAGHATPEQVEKMFSAILEIDENIECTCHFHNTYGLALANCYAAMKVGVTSFESSVAGLGGCPFTKIAGGNTCTEDFVHMLQRMGWRNDIALDKLIEIAQDVSKFFGREMEGKVYSVGRIPDHEPVQR